MLLKLLSWVLEAVFIPAYCVQSEKLTDRQTDRQSTEQLLVVQFVSI